METCSSAKKSYLTHDSARRVARRQMARQRKMILRVYRCKECHLWHMTSTPQMPAFQTLKYLRMKHEVQW